MISTQDGGHCWIYILISKGFLLYLQTLINAPKFIEIAAYDRFFDIRLKGFDF
jgi:hypothetical protein